MRKRKSFGPISAREARVATFIAGCQQPAVPASAQPEPGEPEPAEPEVEKKRKAPKAPKERKDAWTKKQQPKAMKAPMTAKERKDAWKLRQQQQLKEMKDLACHSKQPPQKRKRQ